MRILCITPGLFIAGSGRAWAQTWTPVSAPNANLNFIVSSADGGTLACAPYPTDFNSVNVGPGLVYVSTNSGGSWTAGNVGDPAVVNWYWTYLAISADGSTLVADSNDAAIYLSTNTGASWNLVLAPSLSHERLGPMAASAGGDRLCVADSASRIYTSTNSGQTWATNVSPSTSGMFSMVGSADGQALIANSGEAAGFFYLSTNFALSWTTISWADLPPARFIGSASAGGGVWTAMAGAGLEISTNSGLAWSLPPGGENPVNPTAVAGSADGTRMIAANAQGIYLTTNTGATCQLDTHLAEAYYLVAGSADGNQWVLSGTNGIHLLRTVPSPKLSLVPSNTNLTLAWTVPSTSFTPQQSSDLIRWSPITNTPTLNAATLQNQLTLAPSGFRTFYRLATP